MKLGQELHTVLVTGGTGFVGGAVAQRLRSESHTVRALVRRNSDTAALTAAGCEPRTGHITDAASVRKAMEGVDGGGLGRGGAITLFLDGKEIGEGRVGATQPMFFSLDETTDVGCETGTMVAEDYTAHTSKFNGTIEWVQLDQGADDYDHLISPEERWHVAMTRQ